MCGDKFPCRGTPLSGPATNVSECTAVSGLRGVDWDANNALRYTGLSEDTRTSQDAPRACRDTTVARRDIVALRCDADTRQQLQKLETVTKYTSVTFEPLLDKRLRCGYPPRDDRHTRSTLSSPRPAAHAHETSTALVSRRSPRTAPRPRPSISARGAPELERVDSASAHARAARARRASVRASAHASAHGSTARAAPAATATAAAVRAARAVGALPIGARTISARARCARARSRRWSCAHSRAHAEPVKAPRRQSKRSRPRGPRSRMLEPFPRAAAHTMLVVVGGDKKYAASRCAPIRLPRATRRGREEPEHS